MKKKLFPNDLVAGDKIKIGERYAKLVNYFFKPGEIIELVNGIYHCPSWWNERTKDFETIYHLFGRHLEDFLDCKIIKKHENKFKRH